MRTQSAGAWIVVLLACSCTTLDELPDDDAGTLAGWDGGACASGPENTAAACADGCSNDGDRFVDCGDFDCADIGGCPPRPDGGVECVSGPEDTPGACSDGCSNDGNAFVDCDDWSCSNVGSCPCVARAENNPAVCSDGCSNDEDDLVDCADPDCAASCADGGASCTAGPENTAAACGDGCSNDGNAFVDCDDWSCSNVGACPCAARTENTESACSDGCSNDGDAEIDCDDADCDGIGSCTICVADCAGRTCGPNGCGGSCGTCTAPASCDGTGNCTTSCPSGSESSATLCGDGCDNDGDGDVDCGDSGCASIGSCPIAPVTVGNVTLAGLRAIRPALDFGDLTVTGVLTIPSRGVSSVTITGATIDISSIDVEFPICNPADRDAPDVTLRATAEVRLGGVDLHGEAGIDELASSSCANCYGGDGGNLTVEAPRILADGFLWLDGGRGDTYYFDGSSGYGCDGGDAGSVVLRSTTSLTCDDWNLSMDGGQQGYRRGTVYSDGDPGAGGRLTLQGPSITIDEIDTYEGNASWLNAQPVPYVPLDIIGQVDQDDDSGYRTNPSAYWADITPTIRDFLEDLYRIEVTTPGMLRVTLEFASSDLDVYLLDGARTRYLTSANGTSRPETFEYPVSAGTYYIAVSFSDDAAPVSTPVSYTIRIR